MNCLALILALAVGTAVDAGVLPHLMFPGAGRVAGQQQPWSIHRPQQQQQQQPQTGDNNYASYLERAAALGADLDLAAVGVQQPVYGIPHRYLSDPYPAAVGAAPVVARPDLMATYSGNPLFSTGMSTLYKNNKRSSASLLSGSGAPGYSNYDLMAAMLNADLAAEEQQQQQQAAVDYLEDEPVISQQDAINFEKYIQRFFQQQQQQKDQQLYDTNYWIDDGGAISFDDEAQDWADVQPQQQQQQPQQQLMDNDEEAAQQLHLLLQQVEQNQRIQKKSGMTTAPAVRVVLTTTSSAPMASTTSLPEVSATRGQKEEAMLRPPAPSKQQQQQPTLTSTTTSAPQPTFGTKTSIAKNDEESTSIYRTIHRLMAKVHARHTIEYFIWINFLN